MIVCGVCGNFKRVAVGGFDIRPAPLLVDDMEAGDIRLLASAKIVYWCPTCDGDGPPAIGIDPETGRPL